MFRFRSSVDEGSRLTSRGTSTIYEQAPHSIRTPTTGQTTTHDPLSTAASVCRLHSRPRPHCSSATLPRFALQLVRTVLLRNAAAVPSSQLHTQAKVSIVLYGLTVGVADRRCSPQHDRHPSLSPGSNKHLVTHCVSAFEFC